MAKYLDLEGLKTLWAKTKDFVNDGLAGKLDGAGGVVNGDLNVTGTFTADLIDSTKFNDCNLVGATNIESLMIGTLDSSVPIDDYIDNRVKRGQANGVASLGSDGKVPSAQLPSYVDDVLEYDAKTNFPKTGEAGKIYVSKNDNKTYRWSGTAYVEISSSLALGETSSTAYAGDKGKKNRDDINQLKTDVAQRLKISEINGNNTSNIGLNSGTYYVLNSFNDGDGNKSNSSVELASTASSQSSYVKLRWDDDNMYSTEVLVAKNKISFQIEGATSKNLSFTDTGLKVDTRQVLDESMAITTSELNSILV